MMTELTNMLGASKMSILNLFFLAHNNAQRPEPAPCLASRPFSLIFLCPKYSKNKQIKNPKSTPSTQPTRPAKNPPPCQVGGNILTSPLYKGGLRGVDFCQED